MFELETEVEHKIAEVCKSYGIDTKQIGARTKNKKNSGTPDLMLFKDGIYYLMEVKLYKNSPFQSSQIECFPKLRPYVSYSEGSQILVYRYPDMYNTQLLLSFLNDKFEVLK